MIKAKTYQEKAWKDLNELYHHLEKEIQDQVLTQRKIKSSAIVTKCNFFNLGQDSSRGTKEAIMMTIRKDIGYFRIRKSVEKEEVPKETKEV